MLYFIDFLHQKSVNKILSYIINCWEREPGKHYANIDNFNFQELNPKHFIGRPIGYVFAKIKNVICIQVTEELYFAWDEFGSSNIEGILCYNNDGCILVPKGLTRQLIYEEKSDSNYF